jgi:hypothetical protein
VVDWKYGLLQDGYHSFVLTNQRYPRADRRPVVIMQWDDKPTAPPQRKVENVTPSTSWDTGFLSLLSYPSDDHTWIGNHVEYFLAIAPTPEGGSLFAQSYYPRVRRAANFGVVRDPPAGRVEEILRKETVSHLAVFARGRGI